MQFKNQFFRKAALTLALSVATAFGSLAATIDIDGLTFTVGTGAKNHELTLAKASSNVPAYAGDIKLPDNPVTYNGEEYKIVGVAAAALAKSTTVTSVYLPDGCTNLPRGAFQKMTALKTLRLPNDIEKFNGNLFDGCSALEEITIPGSATALGASMFANCTSLKKVTFAEGDTPLTHDQSTALPTSGEEGKAFCPIEEVVMLRNMTGFSKPAEVMFRGCKTLSKVTIGGKCTQVNAYYFENCPALTEVTIGESVTTIESNAFAGTPIAEITLPQGVTSLSSSTFQNCKSLKKVTLGDAVTVIGEMAFYNAPIEEINFPATLTTVGAYAFAGAKISGDLALPATVTYVGTEAFRNNTGLTSVAFGPAVKTIAEAAFRGCSSLKSISVDAANEAYKVEDNALLTKNGATILLFPAANEAASYSNATATRVADYAFLGAKNLTDIVLPAVKSWGDYALSNTGIKAYAIGGTVGRYVFQGCKNLESVKLTDGTEIPFGIVKNCTSLTKFETVESPIILKQEAFMGATALKEVNLGSLMSILEADAFTNSGIENIIIAATYPSAMAENVLNASMSNVKATVPVDLVDAYKAADGWKYLQIVGDANLAAGGKDMGMPAGLYYAGQDGDLHCVYSDGATDDYNVGGVPHTFQLIEFNNRIYGSSAGNKFVYSATSGSEGDGKLFYISRVDGNIFQAVVLDNKGGNAYQDPFNLYIYGETLYVNDRNVAIRKIPASAIALPINYPSWVENNWLGYYNNPWTYGCIKCGFAITQDKDAEGNPEPLYWLGLKYNGNGIYRFKESDINHKNAEGTALIKPEYVGILENYAPIFTTFNIDEKHGDLYIYIEKGGQAATPEVACGPEPNGTLIKAGLYRAKLADVLATPNPSASDIAKFQEVFTLVDGSPVRFEGSGTNEHVGISQLSFDKDNEYMYWCHRAPTETDVEKAGTEAGIGAGRYAWAEAYDATNPLHQSGIKRLKLGDPDAKVEMVAPGVEGYGVVAVNYEGSKKEDGVTVIVSDKTANDRVIVSGDSFTLTENGLVKVYALNGSQVSEMNVAAGENTSLFGNATGVYVVEAIFADGAKQVVKVAVR